MDRVEKQEQPGTEAGAGGGVRVVKQPEEGGEDGSPEKGIPEGVLIGFVKARLKMPFLWSGLPGTGEGGHKPLFVQTLLVCLFCPRKPPRKVACSLLLWGWWELKPECGQCKAGDIQTRRQTASWEVCHGGVRTTLTGRGRQGRPVVW